MTRDPVFYLEEEQVWEELGGEKAHPTGWYFWNETWSDCYGPYVTEEECRHKLAEYCKTL
jgi:hypothetical protein